MQSDTLVALPLRGLVRASALYAEPDAEYSNGSALPTEPIYALELASGASICAAASTRVRTPGGSLPLSEVKPNTYVVCARAMHLHGEGSRPLETWLAPLALGEAAAASTTGPTQMSTVLGEWLGLVARYGSSRYSSDGALWALQFDTSTARDGTRPHDFVRLGVLRRLTYSLFGAAACGQLFEEDNGETTHVIFGERVSDFIERTFGVSRPLTREARGVAQRVPTCVLSGSAPEKAAFVRGVAPRPSSNGWRTIYQGAASVFARELATLLRTFEDAAVRLVAGAGASTVLLAGAVVRRIWVQMGSSLLGVHEPNERVVAPENALKASLPRAHKEHSALEALKKRMRNDGSTWAWRSTLQAAHVSHAASSTEFLDLVRSCAPTNYEAHVYGRSLDSDSESEDEGGGRRSLRALWAESILVEI